MPGLRLLKGVSERKGVELDVNWIAFAEKRYVDRFSRSWDPAVHQLTYAVTALLNNSLSIIIGKRAVLRCRMSVRESTRWHRRSRLGRSLSTTWGDGRGRFLILPPEMLRLTLSKMSGGLARGIVEVPL